MSSNFYAICDGKIWTEDRRVLSGITRSLIMDIVKSRGFPIIFEGINILNVKLIEEAFISSASRGVLPVIQVNDIVIGQGSPGKWTEMIMFDYAQKIEEIIETIY
jgi:branched-subunit amino acid aminotransferase/4-amino-4-deoxychorismate lyase